MTSEQVPSRTPITAPFAQNGDRAFIDSTDTDNMNFPTGFPSVFGAPRSQGGKYLQRSELNSLGHIATNDLFYHKCGGINTFDPEFASAVGGYPKGAVLQYLNGRYIYDVISLKDNNTYNFVSANTIDNVNWAYCNRDASTGEKILMFESNGPFIQSTSSSYDATDGVVIGLFSATKSSAIITASDASGQFGDSSGSDTQIASPRIYGFSVLIKDIGTSMDAYSGLAAPKISNYSSNGWIPIFGYQFGSVVWTLYHSIGRYYESVVTPLPIQTMLSEYGHFYAVAYMLGFTTSVETTFSISNVSIYLQ